MGLKQIIILCTLLIAVTFSVVSVHASPLNASRMVRIGLVSQGRPTSFQLEPSTGYTEIFDSVKRQAVYSGKAALINVSLMKDQKLKIIIDNNKTLYSASEEVLFSTVGRPPINMKIKAGARKSFAYRGSVALQPGTSGILAVNHVDVEDYLKSVVPSEIFNRAPDAAQEAQTIAARTYAFRNIARHSKSDNYQLCDTVHCQVYVGIVREVPPATKAVRATEGRVLMHEGQLANTVYHSNCGGNIISNSAAWKGPPVSYLIGHYDGVAGEEPFCSFGNRLKKNQPTGKLPKPRTPLVIKPLPLNATALITKNFGHRVGMCQDGAIGMAAIGYSSRQILAFYYPGTRQATMNYVVPGRPSRDEPDKPVIMASAKDRPILQIPNIPPEVSALTISKKTLPPNNLLAALKEVATNRKTGSTSSGMRKMFWNPAQPEISRQNQFF